MRVRWVGGQGQVFCKIIKARELGDGWDWSVRNKDVLIHLV